MPRFAVLLLAAGLRAGTISSTSLTVVVNEVSGAIDGVTYQGTPMLGGATGYGFQTGSDTATFASPPAGVTVTAGGGVIQATGSFGPVAWVRTYTLVGDVLHIVMTLTNLSGQPTDLRYFGTYNPGGPDPTENEAVGAAVRATLANGVTLIVGSRDPAAVVDLGSNGFGALLDQGIEANWLFLGSDGGGATGDFGLAIGFATVLAGGASITFEYQHAYGASPAAAWAAYDEAIVPEPASALLAAAGLAALLLRTRQRSRVGSG